MNLLLVDDDAYVLEAVKNTLDWKKLEIENVYTAQSVKNAKKIIQDIPIHLVVSDIEMPKENGLELISWIREQELVIKDILLTSYAEFEYARRAVKLNSFAYTLKPIDFEELEALLLKAVAAEKEELERLDYRRYYEHWNKTEKNRKELFFRGIILERQNPGQKELELARENYMLSYEDSEEFQIAIFRLYDYEWVHRDLGTGMLVWSMKNVLEEMLNTTHTHVESVISDTESSYIVVLKVQQKKEGESIRAKGKMLIENILRHFHSKSSLALGEASAMIQLQESCKAVKRMLDQSADCEGRMLLLQDYVYKTVTYQSPNWKVWGSLIQDGNAVIPAVNEYLDNLIKLKLANAENVSRFTIDFVQEFVRIYQQNGISTVELEEAGYRLHHLKEAVHSVRESRSYIESLVAGASKLLQERRQSTSAAEKVKRYIDEHTDQELTRESLAEMVYLNPDYLARIFKKEIGEPIGVYLINQRMAIAKEYLEKTEEPVNLISVKVGYDNFSYFSKIFKNTVGMTPKEYRNQFRV